MKNLPLLKIGDNVVIQNQLGNQPRRRDRSGTVIKVNGFDQYEVMTHGSRRITLRNRKYLRKVSPPKDRTIVPDIPQNEEEVPDVTPLTPPPTSPGTPGRRNNAHQGSNNEEETSIIPQQSTISEQERFEDVIGEQEAVRDRIDVTRNSSAENSAPATSKTPAVIPETLTSRPISGPVQQPTSQPTSRYHAQKVEAGKQRTDL